MNERELRSGRSVDRPYTNVKDAIESDALGLFQSATTSATAGVELPDATLNATFGGHDVHRDVHIEITSFDTSGRPPSALVLPGFAVAFRWWAASAPSLFPTMRATLTAYPLSDAVTQLDFHGWYTPPGSALGFVAEALNQHRIAEASVHGFLQDVVRRLSLGAADQ